MLAGPGKHTAHLGLHSKVGERGHGLGFCLYWGEDGGLDISVSLCTVIKLKSRTLKCRKRKNQVAQIVKSTEISKTKAPGVGGGGAATWLFAGSC